MTAGWLYDGVQILEITFNQVLEGGILVEEHSSAMFVMEGKLYKCVVIDRNASCVGGDPEREVTCYAFKENTSPPPCLKTK